MDLYADLPTLDKDGNSTTSMWASTVASPPVQAGKVEAPSSLNATSKINMVPMSLSGGRSNKSPNTGTATQPKISLAFKPAAFSRKSTTVAKKTSSPSPVPPLATQSGPQQCGLGFVGATKWTKVTVQKENQSTADNETHATSSVPGTTHFFQASYRDEYNPSLPNSYEVFCEQRTAKEKMEQVKIDLERRQREQEIENQREREQLVKDVAEGKAPAIALPVGAGRGRGMNIPAWMRKKIEESAAKGSNQTVDKIANVEKEQFEDAPQQTGLGFTVGSAPECENSNNRHKRSRSRSQDHRDYDGISSPKRSRPNELRQDYYNRGLSSRSQDTDNRRVVLLKNMVGPGEVDDELQDEVREECAGKYGAVSQVIVYEMHGRYVTSEQAVRIFIQFERPSDAGKAVAGLNGRFFGGRRVSAEFYDEIKFVQRQFEG